jgi:hypothetical protein
MKVVAVHRDALVVTSRMWQTNATALRSGNEALLFDAPFFPDELEALPALLQQAGIVDAAGRPKPPHGAFWIGQTPSEAP